MDDEISMRAADRRGDVTKKHQTGGERQLTVPAIVGERLALDEFHHQVAAAFADSSIEHTNNVGMIEACQDLPLLHKAPLGFGRQQAPPDDLDGYFATKLAIIALSAIYNAHTAFADFLDQPVRAEPHSRLIIASRFQKSAGRVMRFEQFLNAASHFRIEGG
jgi:hypothetical protein